MVAGVIAATLVATIGLGAAAAFGSRDVAPDRAIVERLGNGATVRWTVTSPAQVEQLYRDTVGLPTRPRGHLCVPRDREPLPLPRDVPGRVDVVLVATFDPGGCRIVVLQPGGPRRPRVRPATASGATWPWRWGSTSTRRR